MVLQDHLCSSVCDGEFENQIIFLCESQNKITRVVEAARTNYILKLNLLPEPIVVVK